MNNRIHPVSIFLEIMVKDVIEEILKEEKKAREHVIEVRDKAKQIRIEAEEQARKIVEEAREEGQKKAKTYLAHEENAAQKQRDQELKKAVEKNNALWKKKREQMDKSVDVLVHLVLGEEHQAL